MAATQPDKWLDGWRYAAGLYTAHYATLYLKTYAPSSETPGQAAGHRGAGGGGGLGQAGAGQCHL